MNIIKALEDAIIETLTYTALTVLILFLSRGNKLREILITYRLEVVTIVMMVFIAVLLASLFGVTSLRDSIKWPLKGGGKDRMPGTLAVAVIVGFITSIIISAY